MPGKPSKGKSNGVTSRRCWSGSLCLLPPGEYMAAQVHRPLPLSSCAGRLAPLVLTQRSLDELLLTSIEASCASERKDMGATHPVLSHCCAFSVSIQTFSFVAFGNILHLLCPSCPRQFLVVFDSNCWCGCLPSFHLQTSGLVCSPRFGHLRASAAVTPHFSSHRWWHFHWPTVSDRWAPHLRSTHGFPR